MIVNGITQNYTKPNFTSRVSLNLKQQLWTEAFMLGEKYMNRVNNKIQKVAGNGREDTVIDMVKSSTGESQHIIVKNPNISQRIIVAISSDNNLYDAFMHINERHIKQAEEKLIDLACKFDN